MSWSRVFWAIGTVAPWCLGAGLAVSFPAGAGQDAAIGGNILPLTALATAAPADIVPAMDGADYLATTSPAAISFLGRQADWGSTHFGLVHSARLVTGNEDADFAPLPDETEPRIKLKKHGLGFPSPDRSNRSDPFIGLRPTFDAKMRSRGTMLRFIAHQQAYSGDVLGFKGFENIRPGKPGATSRSAGNAAGGGSSSSSATATTSVSSAKVRTGLTHGHGATLVSRPVPGYLDGSTPAVSRAVALSSMTPAGLEATPQVISARLLLPSANEGKQGHGIVESEQGKTRVARSGSKPNYLAMLTRAGKPEQRTCLAQAIYFESRSESEAGQAAVAQVVLNRTLSGLYPNSVCGVVFQNRHRYKACQFSFACEGKSLRITDGSSWSVAKRIANEVLEGHTYSARVGGSTHYHATYVRPKWAKKLKRMNKIGTHIFYKLRPGQT